MSKHGESLRRLGVCPEAVVFAETHKTLGAAWTACARGDWMLWYAGKVAGGPTSAGRRKLVLAACACARKTLKHLAKGERRPLAAIRTAERWARGERGVTLAQVDAAAYVANAAAANAAVNAAYVANAANAAANAANAAVNTAVNANTRTEMLARCAVIVRKHYPTPPRDSSSKTTKKSETK